MTLDDEQARRLSALAEPLQTSPEDLARAAINDLVARHAGAFDAAAKFVLEKNHELYRRFSWMHYLTIAEILELQRIFRL